jgi:hypothetical protein
MASITFTVQIETANEAVIGDGDPGLVIEETLHQIIRSAQRLEDTWDFQRVQVLDTNGNSIGHIDCQIG